MQTRPILDAFAKVKQRGETAFLATVVNTQGSTYRRPGARMLITPTETIRMLSGGCLEQDILERTQKMSSGEAIVVTYDSTSESEDILCRSRCSNSVAAAAICNLRLQHCYG